MPFMDIIGLGATAVFGLGVGIKTLGPIMAPTLKKIASGGFKTASFAARQGIAPITKGAARTMPWAVGSASKLAFKTGKFALRHPYMTAGAIGAGAYLATEKSPYESPSMTGKLDGVRLSARFNEEQMAADALNQSGVAPMGGIVSGAAMRNQRLMESTYGLTQGLHRSRH